LEINGYGIRKARAKAREGMRPPYPHAESRKLAAEYGISCVVNFDAHSPVDTAANLEEGRAIARQFDLDLIEGSRPRP